MRVQCRLSVCEIAVRGQAALATFTTQLGPPRSIKIIPRGFREWVQVYGRLCV